MAADNKSKSASVSNDTTGSKKRKHRYLPQNRPVKKKGQYPLHPGVQAGFFITCDGGREHQASREAINVIDSFFEELVLGNDTGNKLAELPRKPLNKKIKFSYSDSSGSDEDDDDDGGGEEDKENNESASHIKDDASNDNVRTKTLDSHKDDDECPESQTVVEPNGNKEVNKSHEVNEAEDPPAKKQCLEANVSKRLIPDKVEEKSIDKLIEAEIKELGDTNKRRFVNLDSGCNGVVFVQMRKRDGDPGPKDIVQHIMTSAAATRKHMSRFILRVLPVEVACYASEEEISKAITPLVAQYFPVETEKPQKFAVLYEARANSGIDRMKIINVVAKSVPGPHKVDLNNPDKTIVVEIVKTVCLIGVVEKYKELAKYNLRQLTSPKP